MADARCLQGEPVAEAFAHVCALPGDGAALRFDEPEVQQARRDALAWWIGMLGDDLVCLTTLAIDASRYGGAITVTRAPVAWRDDPFARLFPGTIVRTSCCAPWRRRRAGHRALQRRAVARRVVLTDRAQYRRAVICEPLPTDAVSSAVPWPGGSAIR